MDRTERFDLGKGSEVAVIESQKLADAMLDHQCHQAKVMSALANDNMFGDQTFPCGIDLGGFGEKFKDGAGRGDLSGGMIRRHAKAVGAGRSAEDDVHLVEALRRNSKMLLVAQREALEGVKSDRAMGMSYLRDAQGNVGVSTKIIADHPRSRNRCSRGYRRLNAPAACGCPPTQAGS
jgi:hypothetical protein